MKRGYFRNRLLISLLALAGAAVEPAFGSIRERPQWHPSYLLQCLPDSRHQDVVDWCRQHSLPLRSRFDAATGLAVVENAKGHTLAAVEQLAQASGLFEFVEPDYPLQAHRLPNDSGLATGRNWGLLNIGQRRGVPDADIDAPEGWDYRTSAADVIVAVIDSGIRYTHEDLRANLWKNQGEIPNNNRDDDRNGVVDDYVGYNAVDHSGDPWDHDGHGTAVSGVVGAVGNNRIGIAGVAWEVQIMALKFLDTDGQGRTSDAIACIDYALAHGANVINASWGGNGRSRSLERAIRRARFADVLFVTAAGNDHSDIDRAPDYPASYSLANIITVGSSTRTDRPSRASNFGMDSVDLFAPGFQIYTCNGSGDRAYGYASGTSLAAPYVTGALALMIAADPGISSFELTSHLLNSVDTNPNFDGLSRSGGRLNLASALSRILPKPESVDHGLRIVRLGSRLALRMQTTPDQPFLLESSRDLHQWRGIQRVQAGPSGQLAVELDETDETALFYRVRPLQ